MFGNRRALARAHGMCARGAFVAIQPARGSLKTRDRSVLQPFASGVPIARGHSRELAATTLQRPSARQLPSYYLHVSGAGRSR